MRTAPSVEGFPLSTLFNGKTNISLLNAKHHAASGYVEVLDRLLRYVAFLTTLAKFRFVLSYLQQATSYGIVLNIKDKVIQMLQEKENMLSMTPKPRP